MIRLLILAGSAVASDAFAPRGGGGGGGGSADVAASPLRASATAARRRSAAGRRPMTLVPLAVPEVARLLATRAPTAQQYATYWGRSGRERYDRALEAAVVTFLGTTFSYFMSYVLGSLVATLFGSLFLFWAVLSPELKARQRNWEFVGGRRLVDPPDEDDDVDSDDYRRGLRGALFVGRLGRLSVVESARSDEEFGLESFEDYTMDTDEQEKITGNPYLLRVSCIDAEDRRLQVHARMSPDYLDLEPGMLVLAVVLSETPSFVTLAALTDLYIPDANVWIGDYPYLDRGEMQALVEEDEQVYQAIMKEENELHDDMMYQERGSLPASQSAASYDADGENDWDPNQAYFKPRRR